MAEVGGNVIDVDLGRKRRLPFWTSTLGSSGTSTIPKTIELNGLSEPSPATKSKKRKVDAPVSEKVIVEPVVQKRVKESSKNQTSTSSSGIKLDKRKSKKSDCDKTKSAGEITVSKRKNLRTKSQENKNGNIEHSISEDINDNKVEITVDDLIRIAKEYVSAADEMELSDITARELNCKTSSASPSVSIQNMSQGFGEVNETRIGMSKCTPVPSSSDHQSDINQHINESSEDITHTNISKTGDAAQDMLDLFLGPLLQDVHTREEKSDIITKEDLSFASELIKLPRSETAGKVEKTLVKKKSSLKDKVAMFLD